jgi:hypothetical protein
MKSAFCEYVDFSRFMSGGLLAPDPDDLRIWKALICLRLRKSPAIWLVSLRRLRTFEMTDPEPALIDVRDCRQIGEAL